MRRSDKDYLRRLANQADDTVGLLSDSRKPEKEQRVCAAFLRCIGVSFKTEELLSVSKGQEPPDVRFRDAAFEVKVEYGNQKVHEKWKTLAQRRRDAKTMDDVLLPPEITEPWSSAQMLECITDILKRQKYSPEARAGLDALIYIDAPRAYLAAGSMVSETTALETLAWRSVSVLFPPYACVLFASTSAPDFLSRSTEDIRSECQDSDEWFEL